MKYQVATPTTKEDWQKYYQLRWEVLRKPWQQAPGSEKDELEDQSIHRMINNGSETIAVGRLHFTDNLTAQIRYMAVKPTYQNKYLGSLILKSLEQAAINTTVQSLFLYARENAVAFYEKHGYKIEKASHLLYGDIQHFLMKKKL